MKAKLVLSFIDKWQKHYPVVLYLVLCIWVLNGAMRPLGNFHLWASVDSYPKGPSHWSKERSYKTIAECKKALLEFGRISDLKNKHLYGPKELQTYWSTSTLKETTNTAAITEYMIMPFDINDDNDAIRFARTGNRGPTIMIFDYQCAKSNPTTTFNTKTAKTTSHF